MAMGGTLQEVSETLGRIQEELRRVFLGQDKVVEGALLRGGRVMAVLQGRDFVTPDDIRELCLPCLRHRVMLTPEADVEGRQVDAVLDKVIESVEVPRE